MMLSVIMLTVPEREKEFNLIRTKVTQQINYCHKTHPTLGKVEIVEVNSKKFIHGGKSIGAKRQQGMNKAKGKYVIWLDDDDNISPDYIETLLRLAESNADVLTFNNLSKFENYWMIVNMSLNNKEDEQAHPGFIKRRPYTICAWKKETVKNVKWINDNINEDVSFINEALNIVKTECHTDNILHEYNRETKSLAVESLNYN
jgi:glycosyltransferase involved in cell wall biosynthesis